MDGNISAGNTAPSSSFSGLLDMQGLGHVHQQHQLLGHHQPRNFQPNSMIQTAVHNVFNHSMENLNSCNQPQTIQAVDYNKLDKGKLSISDDDDISEGGFDEHKDGHKDNKSTSWQRMKWTDSMVRLLITIVSYLGEDAQYEGGLGRRRKFPVLQKKGKWKLVSEVMAHRGCYVSPQQCEDKFNDLNKRYKRLVDVLGRGTSCKVVETPTLLDYMDHLSEKAKDDVRKILSSKHLFYKEMCSYHNGNTLYLPPDPELHKLLQLALKNRCERDTKRGWEDDMDEEVLEADCGDQDDEVRDNSRSMNGGMPGVSKRSKQCQADLEQQHFCKTLRPNICTEKIFNQTCVSDMNCSLPDGTKTDFQSDQWLKTRSIQLEEQKLHLKAQMLELEEQRVKWQRLTRKKDKELEKMRLENERLKMENEKMALELKQLDIEASTSARSIS